MVEVENKKDRLLAAVLNAQLEEGSGETFDATEALASLRSGGTLSSTDRKTLLSSPAARTRMRDALEIADAELLSHVRERQIDLVVTPLVAAADEQMVTVEAKGWRLTVYKEDLPHMAYSLTLQLGDELRQLAPVRIKVVDDGELCWLDGKPDARAELTQPWTYDTTPIVRLSLYSLRLELSAA